MKTELAGVGGEGGTRAMGGGVETAAEREQ